MHIVVIGGSSGIGAETAVQCAEAGACVSICSRREERLLEVLKRMKGRHGYGILDVRNENDIKAVFDRFVSERGPFDGLVYASGISRNMTFNVIKPEHFYEILQVNLIGAMLCTQEAINVKRVNKSSCSIVWISSISHHKPNGAGGFMYSASKAGLIGGMRVLAIELAKRNIRVNAICPAAVDTEIWDKSLFTDEQKQKIFSKHLLGVGQPGDVANACVYLLSHAAKWVTGMEMLLDGGFTLL